MSNIDQNTLTRFIEMCISQKGLLHNTVQAYQNDLNAFIQFLDKKSLSPKNISDYMSHLSKAGASPKTRARHLCAIKQLCKFMFNEGDIDHNPGEDISSIKYPKVIPDVLSEDEIKQLINTCSNLVHPDNKRAIAIIYLLYSAGLRVSELISIKQAHFLSAKTTKSLLILGKGSKERTIPLLDIAIAAMKEYNDTKNLIQIKSNWFFPSAKKLTSHLSRQRVFQILKQLAEMAEINVDKVSPHVLRHSFATHLLQGGMDIISVQRLLGHQSINTTEIYTKVNKDHLIDFVVEKHPLGRKA